MGTQPKTILRRYSPFLVVLAVQLLLIGMLPSRGRVADPLAGLDTSSHGSAGSFGPTDATGVDGAGGTDAAATATGQAGTGPTAGAASRTGPGAAGTSASAGGSNTPGAAGGDRSHCTPDGFQQGVTSFSAPCVPKFVGDNGGATYAGVTGEVIRAVLVRNTFGPVVDGALAAGGLAASPEDEEATMRDFATFFNKHYETYGRTVEWSYYLASCDMSTSVECARTEARKIKEKFDPFIVATSLAVFPAYHDELSKLGIVNLGGWHQPAAFMQRLRPFHYDWMPDGSRIAVSVGDYWCKKMAGKNATLAGDPTYRALPRTLGILAPDSEEDQIVVGELVAHISRHCPTQEPLRYKYSGGFDKAGEQFANIAADLRNNRITTVVCLCDPIRPIFWTQAATNAQYFPEHLLSGMGASDHDYFGRLYDPAQWRNAFGPGIQSAAVELSAQDDARAYADVGAEYRCYACLANFIWMHLATIQLQMAGPNLNPLTLEAGTLALPPLGGYQAGAGAILVKFGAGQYTAVADSMETYYSPTAPSHIDGRPGAYVCVQPDCRRFEIGQRPPGEPKVPH